MLDVSSTTSEADGRQPVQLRSRGIVDTVCGIRAVSLGHRIFQVQVDDSTSVTQLECVEDRKVRIKHRECRPAVNPFARVII